MFHPAKMSPIRTPSFSNRRFFLIGDGKSGIKFCFDWSFFLELGSNLLQVQASGFELKTPMLEDAPSNH